MRQFMDITKALFEANRVRVLLALGDRAQQPMKGLRMVLTISNEELVRMKAAVLDGDRDEALALIKTLLRRLEQQSRQGLKSHLEK